MANGSLLKAIALHTPVQQFTIRSYSVCARIRKKMDAIVSEWTTQWIHWAYEQRNPAARTFWLNTTIWLRKITWLVLREIVVDVILYEGISKNCHQPFKLLYIGDHRNVRMFLDSEFEPDQVHITSVGKCTFFELNRFAHRAAGLADLIVVERISLGKWLPKSGDWIFTPSWPRMVRHFPEKYSVEELVQSIWKDQRRNIKRVRSAGFTIEFSKAPDDFAFFFEKMHAPSMTVRHGKNGIRFDAENQARLARIGTLSFVCLPDGKRISGSIGIIRNGVWYSVANGFLDGDEQWLRAGALSATYLLSLQYAVEQRLRIYDVDNAYPFETNGLFLHKYQWGFHPEINPWYPKTWVFWMPTLSDCALTWFAQNRAFRELAQWQGENIEPLYASDDHRIKRPTDDN